MSVEQPPTYDVFLHVETGSAWYWLAHYNVYQPTPEAAIDQMLLGFTARNSPSDFTIREARAYPSSACVKYSLEATPAPLYERQV